MKKVLSKKNIKHELVEWEQCSLFNSEYEYRDGFDRGICSCGWKSAPSSDHNALVALFKIHKEEI